MTGFKPPAQLSFVHSKVKKVMTGNNVKDLKISEREGHVIKRNLDNYLMYIWTLMGDNRYNRSGYRNAFETLEQHINNNF